MVSLKTERVERFADVARQLKAAGDGSLRKEFYSGISRSTKPLIADVRTSAMTRLPRSGGLGARVAKSKITTKRRMAGRSVGVRIVGTSNYDLKSIDRGRIRHLVYGHKPWINQSVKPKFWSAPLEAGGARVRYQLEQVISDVARKLGG